MYPVNVLFARPIITPHLDNNQSCNDSYFSILNNRKIHKSKLFLLTYVHAYVCVWNKIIFDLKRRNYVKETFISTRMPRMDDKAKVSFEIHCFIRL